MSYTEAGLSPGLVLPAGTALITEVDIGAASSDVGDWIFFVRAKVSRVYFILVSEAAGGSGTAPTVVFTKRPTPGSATGASAVATITVPDGTAVGKCVYADCDVEFAPGDALHIAWTIGITGPTGQGFPGFRAEPLPDNVANASDFSESA